MDSSRRTPRSLASELVIASAAVLGGALFGVLDRLAAHGPPWALDLSNVACFWLAAAFVAGMCVRSHVAGAALGLLCLVGALLGYYGSMFVWEHEYTVRYLEWRAAPWVVASAIVGPVFGALGAAWSAKRSIAPIVALAAAFWLDGIGYAALTGASDRGNLIVHSAVAAMGVALGVALVHSRRHLGQRSPR